MPGDIAAMPGRFAKKLVVPEPDRPFQQLTGRNQESRIPKNVVKPKLYDWLQSALVSGAIPRGSARLYGAMDKFPFDDGEGQLLIQGNVRNTVLKYRPEWPATDLIDVDVVVDNVRLYSERGRSSSLGNDVVDAKVEIADLRKPVLSINAFSTGTPREIGTLPGSPLA